MFPFLRRRLCLYLVVLFHGSVSLAQTAPTTRTFSEIPTDWATNTAFLSERSHTHLKSGEVAKSYFWANRWLEADTRSVEANLIRAESLMGLQAPAAAIEACDAGIALNPPAGFRLFRLLSLRASALDSVGEAEAAWNDIQRAREVAQQIGEGAVELRRGTDQLQWRLLARMQSGPSREFTDKRQKSAGAEVLLLARTAEARRLVADDKADEARSALREVLKQPAAPPDAAYLLWSLERNDPDSIERAAARKRALQLGFHKDLLLEGLYGGASDFAPKPVPILSWETALPELSPTWYQWVLAAHAKYSKQHPPTMQRNFRREFTSIRQRMTNFPERMAKLQQSTVTDATWRAAVAEAAGMFQALGQLSSDWGAMTENASRINTLLQEARYAVGQSKKPEHQMWAKELTALAAKTEKLARTLSAQYKKDAGLSKEMDGAAYHFHWKHSDVMMGALARLWQKRVADEVLAKSNGNGPPATLLQTTDDLIAIAHMSGADNMTPALWYRRADAARQLGLLSDALLAGATARSEEPAAAEGEPVRRWMDGVLSEAQKAPESAAREKAAGRVDAALTILQRAAAVNRADGVVHLALAEIYAEVGETRLARAHTEATWRCYLHDRLEIRRLLNVALQSSHWRLVYVASGQLLKADPLDAEARYSHALGAAAMGDHKAAYDQFRVLDVSDMLGAQGSMASAMVWTASQAGDKFSGAYDAKSLAAPDAPHDLRFWTAILTSLAKAPLPENLVAAAPAEQQPRLELLTSYLAGKLSPADYHARAEAAGQAGFANFAISFRSSFLQTDKAVKQQLLVIAEDASLPALWRVTARLRAHVLFGLSSDGPLTSREPVLIPFDAKTLDAAIDIAAPAQRIQISEVSENNKPKTYDLPPMLPKSLRISSLGRRTTLHFSQQELFRLGEMQTGSKSGAGLLEFDGVELKKGAMKSLQINGGFLGLHRSVSDFGLPITLSNGAIQFSHSSSGLSQDEAKIAADGIALFADSAVLGPLDVTGELLLQRTALADTLSANGVSARVMGQHTRHIPVSYQSMHSTGPVPPLRADGGAKMRLADSLVDLMIGDKPVISKGAGSLIEIERVVVRDNKNSPIVEEGGGRVLVTKPTLIGTSQPEGQHAASEVKTASELTAALHRSKTGDTIKLLKGDYLGSFNVPAGVNLVGEKGVRLMADIGNDVHAVGVSGKGVTSLSNLEITLQIERLNQDPITPKAGQESFSALHIAADSFVHLNYCILSTNSSYANARQDNLFSFRLESGAGLFSTASAIYASVFAPPRSYGWLHGIALRKFAVSGGGLLVSTMDNPDTFLNTVSGTGTTFIASTEYPMLYLGGAFDPNSSDNPNSSSQLQATLWKAARRELDKEIAAAQTDRERFQALMAFDRKIYRVGRFAHVPLIDSAQHSFREMKPFITNANMTARVLLQMQSHGDSMKKLFNSLDYATQEQVRKYMKTVGELYAERSETAHENILARMAYWNAYPPGSKYHEAALQAAKRGQTLAQFRLALAAEEKSKAEAARRAAELARQAQLVSERRAASEAASAWSRQSTTGSSYTPTWDGSFSTQAMASWEKLNRQVQASQQRYYEREYKAGNRSVPW